MLIEKCICGGNDFAEYGIENNIPLIRCNVCGVLHQEVDMTPSEYFSFYDNYHGDYQTETGGLAPHKERYNHDFKIAELRYNTYKDLMPTSGKTLDIGASNGAFVDYMAIAQYDAYGIEIGADIEKGSTIYNKDLLELNLQDEFVLITLHDVFEHFINPTEYLIEMKRILSDDGLLVIDIPDYFEPNGKGLHHWREIQHLWYFTKEQLNEYFEQFGFEIKRITNPIPGKVVYYLGK